MASGAIEAVRGHWPEYLIEAAGLALFMISAGAFGTLLEYPQSPVRGMLPDPLVRRALMGIAMGATAIGLIPALHLPELRLQRACHRRAAPGGEAQPEQCGRAGI